jgi:Tol biopolymer transport system component
LGGYEVIAPVGKGGMGEVYRARDLTLERDVAIKVLPPLFATDAERLARFAREARLLAALNHPHIAAIHGVAETPDYRALVLEFVEGQTLAERLRRGPIEPGEAVLIARQISEALEAAHEKGIVHRDLKPANVKLTTDGRVKVLDFGLAKALDMQSHDDRPGETHTIPETGTRSGVVLGTFAYMSPEQARGEPVDKRADIWAFGCVLYELLTGRAPFAAPTPAETMSAILGREPDWNALPAGTPASVHRILRRSLDRDPKRRLRDIGDARLDLESPLPDATTEPVAAAHTTARTRARAAVTAGVVLAGVALAAWGWLRPREALVTAPVRVSVRLAPGTTVSRGPQFASSVALSPDGRQLVIAGRDATGLRLYRRPLDQLEPTPLAGTEGGSSPFFSPDGAWVGFFAAERLRRIPAAGGAVVDITAGAGPQIPRGATWLPDDRIVFASGAFTALQIVPASGGTPQPLTRLDDGAGESGHSDPHGLPDGRTLLFTVAVPGGSWIESLDLPSGRRGRVTPGFAPRLAASGHMLLSRGANLLGAVFDPARMTLAGPAVPLVEGIARGAGPRHYAVAGDGTLAYVPDARSHALVLRGADGTDRTVHEARLFENPRFAPNGRHVVVAATRRSGDPLDLWVHDLEAGTASRLTFDGGRAPVWTPDGTAVTYSHLGQEQGIYTRPFDGSGAATRLASIDAFHWLVGWTPDARTLVYGVMDTPTPDGRSPSSIIALTNGQSRQVVGPGSVFGGRLSPDGRWLTYYILEPSGFEIYVTTFPDAGSRWLIADGTDPSWSPDGTEIYYRAGDRLMAARIDTLAGVRVLSSRVAVDGFLPPSYDDFDIHPDRRTLALVQPMGDAIGREVTMVLGWFADLKRLIPGP